MWLFDKILRFFRRTNNNTYTRSTSSASAPRYGSPLLPSTAGAMGVSTVYACVNLLANSVANLPLQYMRLKDGIFSEDVNSRLYYLLRVQPCPYMSAFDFWHTVMVYYLLRGNAYIVPVYNSYLEIERLALADPTSVSHDTLNDTYSIHDVNAGLSGTWDEDEIIHLKNLSFDGKRGLSTLSFARLAISTAAAGDSETIDRFTNGGNVRGLVSNDTSVRGFGEYQDEQLAKTATDLDSRFRSGERIVSLPGQVQFSPISLTSTDMQFLETRKFSVTEICRFFGVHPSFVFGDTATNYKSAEMANVAFLSNTLNPILGKTETELLRKLVAPSLAGKRKFEFDRRGLYACDLDTKVKYQTQTIAAGLYTVNDWRKVENKPAVEGGDKVLVSANLKSINELGQNNDTNNDNAIDHE